MASGLYESTGHGSCSQRPQPPWCSPPAAAVRSRRLEPGARPRRRRPGAYTHAAAAPAACASALTAPRGGATSNSTAPAADRSDRRRHPGGPAGQRDDRPDGRNADQRRRSSDRLRAGGCACRRYGDRHPADHGHRTRRAWAAYRLTPEGQTFAQPVSLTFKYSAAVAGASAPDLLRVATQTAQGTWSLPATTRDAAQRTLSVATTHFSDWATVSGLLLRPEDAVVRSTRR